MDTIVQAIRRELVGVPGVDEWERERARQMQQPHLTFRLLVTGTRRVTDEHLELIEEVLLGYTGGACGVLAHGDAPGVDRIAARIFTGWGWTVHGIPADWDNCAPDLPYELGGCPERPHRKTRHDGTTYCPRAGNRRNQVLADLKPCADVAVAFPARGSSGRSGTWDAAHRFADAGIPVHVHPLEVTR